MGAQLMNPDTPPAGGTGGVFLCLAEEEVT